MRDELSELGPPIDNVHIFTDETIDETLYIKIYRSRVKQSLGFVISKNSGNPRHSLLTEDYYNITGEIQV